jgi:hypothetical protein
VPEISFINAFESVTLEDIIKVKLMNRIDRKFWFHDSLIKPLLEALLPFYDVLEVNDKRIIQYQTIYFEVPGNELFLKHHNGYRDRYKIRRRKYSTSASGYFEIKRKTNKERTIKSRIEVPFTAGSLTQEEYKFLKEHSPYGDSFPEVVLFNSFNRISLVDKEKTERCTIDLGLKLWNARDEVSPQHLAIIEVKRGHQLKASKLVSILKELGIRHRGLSKYCTGRTLIDSTLKQNSFKPRLMNLEKKILNKNEKCLIF